MCIPPDSSPGVQAGKEQLPQPEIFPEVLSPVTRRDVLYEVDPGRGQAGMGRSYPARERKDVELYSVKVPKGVETGR